MVLFQEHKSQIRIQRGTITEWLSIKVLESQANKLGENAEEIITEAREKVIKDKDKLLEIGKSVDIEEIKDEEDGEKTEVYFYVIVDDDIYKVEQKGASFIGRNSEFPPTIEIKEIDSTTSTITVTVETQKNEGGKIQYYIKGEEDDEYKLKDTIKGTTYEYKGLEQNKKYNIKVIAIAKNKKTAEAVADKTTGNVPNLTEADIKLTYKTDEQEIDNNTWTNKTITVTASTTITGYNLQTSKDSEKWEDTDNQKFDKNGIIYVRLWDGTNYGGTAAGNITKIDSTPSVIKEFKGTASSIIATQSTLSATVNDANSGLAKIVWQWGTSTNYENSITSDYQKINGTEAGTIGDVTKTCELTKLSAGTTYYAKISVYDVAGNETTQTTTFKTGNAVAQVDSTLYTSVQNGINEISKENSTITLLVNQTESVTVSAQKNIRFNLNGKTLTGTVTNNGTLALIGGTITLTSNTNKTVYNTGNLTLESGTISGGAWTVHNAGTFYMQGGTVNHSTDDNGTALMNEKTLYITGGTIRTSGNGLVTINKGVSSVRNANIIQNSDSKQNVILGSSEGETYVYNSTINTIRITNTSTGAMRFFNCNFVGTASFSGKIVKVTTNSLGYYVTIVGTGIGTPTAIQFPTWTELNGQDDLNWYIQDYDATKENTVFIKKSDHNNESGKYITHIYAKINGTYTFIDGFSIEL